ncbi:MarR family winged helix-turn-helix transcriptional regulator [Angustibacter aerolatus]
MESRQLAAQLHRLALLEDGNDIVPVRQQRMLRVLDARPGLMLKDLATALGMTEPSCTRMLDRAIEAGFAAKERHPDNGQAISITLTADGSRALQQVTNALAVRLRAVVRAGGPDVGQVHPLIEQLTHLADRLGAP